MGLFQMCRNVIDPATNESVFTFLSEFYTPWKGGYIIEQCSFTCTIKVNVCNQYVHRCICQPPAFRRLMTSTIRGQQCHGLSFNPERYI